MTTRWISALKAVTALNRRRALRWSPTWWRMLLGALTTNIFAHHSAIRQLYTVISGFGAGGAPLGPPSAATRCPAAPGFTSSWAADYKRPSGPLPRRTSCEVLSRPSILVATTSRRPSRSASPFPSSPASPIHRNRHCRSSRRPTSPSASFCRSPRSSRTDGLVEMIVSPQFPRLSSQTVADCRRATTRQSLTSAEASTVWSCRTARRSLSAD